MGSPVLIVGGIGSVATLADVARVARGGAVQLDTAASKRIDKQADKKTEPLDPAASGDDSASRSQSRQLTKQQARAAALAHLLPLVNGSSGVRLGLVELIVRQLAPEAQPLHVHAGSEAAMAAQILAAAAPLSGGFQPTGPEQAVLSSGVSAAEAATLKLGQSSAAGVAALSIADAQLLVAAASPAVTALSAEALQAQVRSCASRSCTQPYPYLSQQEDDGRVRFHLSTARMACRGRLFHNGTSGLTLPYRTTPGPLGG